MIDAWYIENKKAILHFMPQVQYGTSHASDETLIREVLNSASVARFFIEYHGELPKRTIDMHKEYFAPLLQINEHDNVEAAIDIEEVPKGSKGVVVYVYSNKTTLEVEFIVNENSIVETVEYNQIFKSIN